MYDKNKTILSEKYFSELHKYRNGLTEKEERDLAARAKTDITARNAMIEANLRFVISCISKYRKSRQDPDFMDLIQSGNLGLCETMAEGKKKLKGKTRYDPEKGRFTTYAAQWISQAAYKEFNENKTLVPLPYNLEHKTRKAVKLKQQYFSEHNEMPAKKWLKAQLNKAYCRKLPDREFETIFKLSEFFEDSALTWPITEVNDESMYHATDIHSRDHCAHEYSEHTYPRAIQNYDLEKLLKKLTPKEERIVRARFGLIDKETLQKLANEFHLTRERIRQIQNKALKKLSAYASESK